MGGRKDKSARPARRQLLKKADVPGPSTNPATNLLIANIAMQSVAILLRRSAERGLLRQRFAAEEARDIIKGRGMVTSMVTTAAARTATRSIPGLLLVSGGLLAKAVFDRSLKRRTSRRKGDQALLEQAEDAPE